MRQIKETMNDFRLTAKEKTDNKQERELINIRVLRYKAWQTGNK